MAIRDYTYKDLYEEYMRNKRSIANAEIHISSLIHCAETVSVERSSKETIKQVFQMIKYHRSLLADIVAHNEDVAAELNRRDTNPFSNIKMFSNERMR